MKSGAKIEHQASYSANTIQFLTLSEQVDQFIFKD